MSEINVTPLVDVMLVLLVIFMVTAPFLLQAVPVNLPKTAPVEKLSSGQESSNSSSTPKAMSTSTRTRSPATTWRPA